MILQPACISHSLHLFANWKEKKKETTKTTNIVYYTPEKKVSCLPVQKFLNSSPTYFQILLSVDFPNSKCCKFTI